VLGVAIDITKSKLAEEALHESERRLRTILQTVNEGFWLIDNDTLTIDLNPRMCAIMDRNREEVLGRKILDFVDNENEALFEQQVKLRAQGQPGAYEIALSRPDGSQVFCQFNVTPFFDGSGNKVGAFAMVTDISERKRAEDALRDNEEKFRSIFDNSLEGILFSAPDGSIFAANRAACEMLGRSEREICEGGRDLVVDMTDPRLQKCLEERKRTGRFLGELNHRRKDGTAFPVEISTSQFSLTNGDLRACIIFRDITERQRMEKSVLESEQRFRTIAETIRDVFWMTTPDASQMIYVSPAYETLWGRSCESLYQASTSFLEAVHPDDQEVLVTLFRGYPEGNWDCEYRIIQQDGGIRWIHARAFPVRNEASEITRMIGTASEITEHKEVEEELRMSEERFSRFFRASPIGTSISLLSDGQFFDANDAFLRLFGYTREEVIGQNPFKLKTWANSEDRAKMVQILQEQGRIKELEPQCLRKSGEIMDVLVSAEVMEVAGQQFVLALTHDITERKRAEAAKTRLEAENRQLQKAESLGRMAGAIAHLFNNHLAVVIGNLEMALMDLSGDALIRKDLIEAMRAARRSADVSGLMLTYLGHSTAKPELLDLSEVCRQNLSTLNDALPESIALKTDLLPSGPVVRANANQMQQVLTHLITNGWESIGHSAGTVTLASRILLASEVPESHLAPVDWKPAANLFACLEVTDTGCGTAEEDLTEIFDPFFTTKFTGRGLGLAVVLGTVKTWGGAIGVKSKKNQGSIFRVFLPLVTGELPRLSEKATQTRQMEPGGTVLLVEDQDTVRNMAESMLKHMGYQVLAASCGAEAVELFSENPDRVSFVITDLTMPVMNGWETLTALRKIQPHIPVVLVSGHDEARVMAENYSKQPHVFLHKPYLKGDMEAAIEAALKKTVSTG
jgi:PAS domain S-box-containing protein